MYIDIGDGGNVRDALHNGISLQHLPLKSSLCRILLTRSPSCVQQRQHDSRWGLSAEEIGERGNVGDGVALRAGSQDQLGHSLGSDGPRIGKPQ